MSKIKEVHVEVHEGFNLIVVIGFEFTKDDEKGISFSYGSWFNSQPWEFRRKLMLLAAKNMLEKAEEMEEDANVRPH